MPAKSWSVWWESELPIAATMNWMWLKRTAMLINTSNVLFQWTVKFRGSNTTWAIPNLCHRKADKPTLTADERRRESESYSLARGIAALRYIFCRFQNHSPWLVVHGTSILSRSQIGNPTNPSTASGCDEARDRKNVDPSRPQTYLSPSLIGKNETPTLRHYALAFQWLCRVFSIMLHERGSLMLTRDFT